MFFRRTGAAVATAALLAVSACGTAGPDGADPRPATSGGSWPQGGSSGTGTFRPLPVRDRLGALAGRDRPGPRPGGTALAARAGRPGHRRVVRRHRRAHRPGPPAAPRRRRLLQREHRRRRAGRPQQPGPAALRGARRPTLAGAGRRRPGGRPGRPRDVRGHRLPRVHDRRRRGGPGADPRGVRRQRGRAARARLHRRLRAGLRRHGRAVRPGDRRALGRLLAGAGRRPGDRRRAGLRVVRPAAGRQALPGPRVGDHRQPLRAAGPAPVAGRAAGPGPGAVPRGRRRRHLLGDGRAPRRARRRPADALVAVPRGGDRAAPRRARLPGRGVHRLAADGGGRRAGSAAPGPPCARCGPGRTCC